VTKPISFQGKKLLINYKTAEKGSVRLALITADGKPLSGFASTECQPLQGDSISQAVSWQGADVGKLADQPVRLVFELNQADVYSFQFVQ
jgi:hypothetical protein